MKMCGEKYRRTLSEKRSSKTKTKICLPSGHWLLVKKHFFILTFLFLHLKHDLFICNHTVNVNLETYFLL